MAGGGRFPPVLTDPAIEKWYHMKENTHAYYKLNRRTVGIAVMLTVVLPAAFYWGSAAFAGKVQPLGSRRGEQWYISNKKEETAAQE